MSLRISKLNKLLKQEISDIILKLKDPRIGFVSITEVDTSADLRHAKVFISILGTEEEKKKSLEGLNSACGFIRHELMSRIKIRNIPGVSFVYDNSIERGTRILNLINKISSENNGE
ncbi:MAG: 30S ribosome-binding factor RbfA [Armatimonadota bacterium]